MAQELYTYNDLVAGFPVDNVRREIISGELIVSPSPKTRHQKISGRLSALLVTHLDTHGGAETFQAPLDVVLSDTDVVQPDHIIVAGLNLTIVTENNIRGVPDLLVEIVSDSRYDRVRKRALYEEYAVAEYWVVDPDADRIEVHRLVDGRYDRPEIFEPSDTLSTTILPGLSIDLASLFAR